MKKLLFIFSGSAMLFLTSCSDKGGMSSAAKKNLEAMNTVNKSFETGDVSGLDNVIADNFVDHGMSGNMNRDSLKSMIKQMKGQTKDTKTTVNAEMANDEWAMQWVHMTGTNVSMADMPPGPYDMNSVELVKFKDGKAIEHWSFMQMKDMMDMMKMMNSQAPMPMTDTTMHK